MCIVIKIIYFKNRGFFFSPEDLDSEGIMVKIVEDESLYKLLVLLKLFLSKKTGRFRHKRLQIMQSASG